jgi:hypothetical protein
VTGDGHGGQPLGCQPFSPQPPASGCQLPMAERPIPELPMPVPVTRHLALCLSLYSILHTRYSRIPLLHLCTRRSRICTFARYPYLPVSPCPHVPSRPLVAFRFSDPMVRPDPVFGRFSLKSYAPFFSRAFLLSSMSWRKESLLASNSFRSCRDLCWAAIRTLGDICPSSRVTFFRASSSFTPAILK